MWDFIPITIPPAQLEELRSSPITKKPGHGNRLLRAISSNSIVDVPRSNLICLCPCKSGSRVDNNLKDGHLLYITPHPEEAHHITEALSDDEEDSDMKTKTYQVASAFHPDQDIFTVRPAGEVSTEVLKDLYAGDSGIPENLDTRAGTREVIIIVSTKSGSARGGEIWESVVKPIFSHFGLVPLQTWDPANKDPSKLTGTDSDHTRLGYKLFITHKKEDIARIARTALSPSSLKITQQNILLLSGDTVISELLNNIPSPTHKYTRTVTLLPIGTGNALSSSHHKFYNPLTNFLLGTPHTHPTFTARFSPGAKWSTSSPTETDTTITTPIKGAVVFSWGFHACLVADSDGETYRQKYGKERFAVAARENLTPAPHVFKGKVTFWGADGQEEQLNGEDHFYVLSTLVSNLEKTLTIAPDAPRPRPLNDTNDDGAAFTVLTIASGTTPERTMDIMKLAYDNGSHVHEPEVTIKRAKKVRIEFHEPDWEPSGDEGDFNPAWGKGRFRRVCLDGATVEVEENGWVDVEVDGRIVELVKG